MMTKARRQELKMLHYKRRLKKMGKLSYKVLYLPIGESKGIRYNFSAYRSHGAPCSCFLCSHRKYSRAQYKLSRADLKEIREDEEKFERGELKYLTEEEFWATLKNLV
jgi:hypothetical protein